MEILTLLKANIRYKKGSFLSVILLMAIITLSFTVTVSNNDNVSDGIERAFRSADTGDFAAFIADSELDSEMLDKITGNSNVGRVRNDEAIAILSYTINKNENSTSYFLLKWENKLSVFDDDLKYFDEEPEDLSDGEAYVPAAMKTVYGCEKGSEISVSTKNGTEKFIVKGFVEEPFLGSMSIGIKQIFISENDFERLCAESLDDESSPVPLLFLSRILHVFRDESSTLSVSELKKELNRECMLVDKSLFTQSKDTSIEITTVFTDTGTKILYVFVTLLIIIILISINHSITATIETEYVSLGILKAQGFTKRQIRLIYALQYFAALVIGGIIGMAASFPLTRLLGKMFQPITGIMTSTNISIGKCMLASLAIIIFCTVYIVLATKKISRISPVRAISGGAEEVHFDSIMNIRVRKKPLSFFIALRQITSHPKAYIGTALIAAILIFFMITVTLLAGGISANSMIEAFGALNGEAYAKINNDFKLSDMEKIENSVQEMDGKASVIFSETAYMTIEETEFCCTIYNDPAILKSILKGRAPSYENEIMITEIASEEINKGMGDTVTVGFGDGRAEYIITGIYQSVADLGRCFAMSFDAASLLGDVTPGVLYISLSEEFPANAVVGMLNDSYGGILEAEITEKSGYADSMTETIDTLMNVVTGAIYAVSAVFALVAVHMVCTKAFLRERYDIGIYKAMGFTSNSLRFQFAVRFLIIAGIGSTAGTLLSLLFSDNILSILLKNIGISYFSVKFTVSTIAVPVLVICGCFFAFSYLVSRKIKSIAIRELVVE